MEPIELKFLRVLTLLPYAIVIVSLHLQPSAGASPLTLTNAASTGNPRYLPKEAGTTSYWIGSHTLNFTPNPFLQRRDMSSESADDMSSSSSMLSSQIETTTSAMVPTTNKPEISGNKTSIRPRPTRKGRKVKGRRKIKNRGSRNSTLPTTRVPSTTSKTTITDISKHTNKDGEPRDVRGLDNVVPSESTSINTHHLPPQIRFTADEAKTVSSILNSEPESPVRSISPAALTLAGGKSLMGFTPNTLPITQPMGKKLPIEEFIHITTPEPILPEFVDPRSNQIPVDFAGVDPDKLNPSYFRNVILKAMMDRLAGVGLVTRLPAPHF